MSNKKQNSNKVNQQKQQKQDQPYNPLTSVKTSKPATQRRDYSLNEGKESKKP